MLQHLRRKCRPATLLLIIGFAISLVSVLIGISSINTIIILLSETDGEIPIYLTMQDTGLSLALEIYLFSIANCLVVTNYWLVTQRHDMAIRKAFGWTNLHLILMLAVEMAETLIISLCISVLLLVALINWNSALFSVQLTPFFFFGTLTLLVFTLLISMLLPVRHIFKINPAEVIS